MAPVDPLIPTTVIGSYPQPGWLLDHDRLVSSGVPRVRAGDLWRVDAEHLPEAFEAAVLVAIADQEAAGIDVITDGEIGRESYFNHFATALSGVDQDRIGTGINRAGGRSRVPVVSGPIERTSPIEVASAAFLRSHTDRAAKVTVPGPFTLSQLAQNDHYPDQRQLALAYATAIRAELLDLAAVGIDVLQLDEPYLQANPAAARDFGLEVIATAVEGVPATTVVHTCYGYAQYVGTKAGGYPFLAELAHAPVDYIAIETAQPGLDPSIVAQLRPRSVVMGVLDLSTHEVEHPGDIAATIRSALAHIPPAELAVSPDCGMKFLPRAVARAKLAAMVEGAALVRAELS